MKQISMILGAVILFVAAYNTPTEHAEGEEVLKVIQKVERKVEPKNPTAHYITTLESDGEFHARKANMAVIEIDRTRMTIAVLRKNEIVASWYDEDGKLRRQVINIKTGGEVSEVISEIERKKGMKNPMNPTAHYITTLESDGEFHARKGNMAVIKIDETRMTIAVLRKNEVIASWRDEDGELRLQVINIKKGGEVVKQRLEFLPEQKKTAEK